MGCFETSFRTRKDVARAEIMSTSTELEMNLMARLTMINTTKLSRSANFCFTLPPSLADT